MAHLLEIPRSHLFVIQRMTELLQDSGFQVSPSFNLSSAQTTAFPCACPHHPENCDCDMAVLMVYGSDPQPAVLVTHTHNERTWLYLVDNPEEHTPTPLGLQIKSLLTASNLINRSTAVG